MVKCGLRKTSIDSVLYKIALDKGVNFEFAYLLILEILYALPEYSIIATGSCSQTFNYMNLHCIV